MNNFATSGDLKHSAFYSGNYRSVTDAWCGLDADYWRHGITVNLGNGMNVSEEEAVRRLNYIRVRLLKKMFGNNFRRKNAAIRFLLFRQGSRLCFNQHFHALMAIEGDHNWSDRRIAEAIREIERTDRKDLGKRMHTWTLIGEKAIGFTVMWHEKRHAAKTAFW